MDHLVDEAKQLHANCQRLAEEAERARVDLLWVMLELARFQELDRRDALQANSASDEGLHKAPRRLLGQGRPSAAIFRRVSP